MENHEPQQVSKCALDVTPYFHGIYCAIGGSKPYVNEIVCRSWSEDGGKIIFMLESHNFDFRHPDEQMFVIELQPRCADAEWFKNRQREDEEKFKTRPPRITQCSHCNGTGKTSE